MLTYKNLVFSNLPAGKPGEFQGPAPPKLGGAQGPPAEAQGPPGGAHGPPGIELYPGYPKLAKLLLIFFDSWAVATVKKRTREI